jgi:hypothetical protein
VEGIKDDATAKKAQKAIEKLKPVAHVAVYPKQSAIGISFKDAGKITTQELVETLKAEGLTASNYP